MTTTMETPTPVDLTNCTRNADKVRTLIFVEDDLGNRHLWFEFGEVQVRSHLQNGVFYIAARLTEGVTDFEHDSAYAFQFEAVGLAWSGDIDHGRVSLSGFVNFASSSGRGFRVPRGPYDPEKLPGASRCQECVKSHLIVPEGYYSGPTSDTNLWNMVRGRRFHLVTGVATWG